MCCPRTDRQEFKLPSGPMHNMYVSMQCGTSESMPYGLYTQRDIRM